MASKSIIDNSEKCFFCDSLYNIERHHCIHGTANRRLAEEDGLWINLCRRHHSEVHGKDGHEIDMTLRRLAEWSWLDARGYIKDGVPDPDGIAAFVKRYGKNLI